MHVSCNFMESTPYTYMYMICMRERERSYFDIFCFRSKVISLVYSKKSHQLVSGGEDAIVVFWDMKANREEVRANF